MLRNGMLTIFYRIFRNYSIITEKTNISNEKTNITKWNRKICRNSQIRENPKKGRIRSRRPHNQMVLSEYWYCFRRFMAEAFLHWLGKLLPCVAT